VRTVALYNLKGGVGKTTSAVNLAWIASRSGARALLWDLDPQASSSYYLRVKPRISSSGRKLVEEETDLLRHVRGSDFEGLDLLPADFSYRKIDRALAGLEDPEERLARLVAPLAEEYDLLFLDCAPSAATLADAIFGISDLLLVPTIPTTLSLRTLARLMKHLKRRRGRRPGVLPFFCLVDERKALHRRVMAFCEEQELGMLGARIPYSGTAEQMGFRREPIGVYAPRSKPALAYEGLWREVEARLGKGERSPLLGKRGRRALESIGRSRPSRALDASTLRPAQGLGEEATESALAERRRGVGRRGAGATREGTPERR